MGSPSDTADVPPQARLLYPKTWLLVQTEVPLVSGVFSDQAFVDRLVKRIQGQFCYVVAWRLWFEKIDGYWRTENAEARLRDEYRVTVEEVTEGDEITGTSRRKAINSISQQAAMWLLREEQKLRAAPEEIALRLKRTGSDSLSACARGFSAIEIQGNLPAGKLTQFFQPARACAKEIPNILIRTDHKAPDPLCLFPDLREIFGERVIQVAWDYWHAFPESLSPALALHMSGAHVMFLTGLEFGWSKSKRFPQWHLYHLLSQPEADWCGKDGAWHRLALPSHFILCGPPVQLPSWEAELRPHLLMLSSLNKETRE
jgi:hypothetical protein